MAERKAELIGIDGNEAAGREIAPLDANKLVVAESQRITQRVILPPGSQLEDLLIPDYWSRAARKLHLGDLIEVTPETMTWWAELVVTEVGQAHARLAVLRRVELPKPTELDDLPLGHRVQFLGPTRKWCAMRANEILAHGFDTKTDAASWLNEALR